MEPIRMTDISPKITKKLPVKHGATFSKSIQDELVRILKALPIEATKPRVLDPFAGIGKIHHVCDRVGFRSVGVELEPEWAEQHERNQVGNALLLKGIRKESFDIVCTSPCYGNRFADHHNAKDPSKRNAYKFWLGRDLSEDSAGALQWGGEYRLFHQEAWYKVTTKLKPGGWFVLNISDHIRGGDRMPVSKWHMDTLMQLGLTLYSVTPVGTPRLGYGENHAARVEWEYIIVLRKEG
jgi:tRNA G10  N-methylase Trm11